MDKNIGGIFPDDSLNELHSRVEVFADVLSWLVHHRNSSISVLLREHWIQSFVQRYDVCDVVLCQLLRILCGSYISQIEIINDFIHIAFKKIEL